MLKILYFARLCDALGSSGESLDLPADIKDIGGLRAFLGARGEVWAKEFAPTSKVRAAVNKNLVGVGVEADAPIKDGDEIAFFPPVSGG